MDEPCTNRIVPLAAAAGDFCHRKSLTSPFLVQCSLPFIAFAVLPDAIYRKFCARIRRLTEEGSMTMDAGTLDTFPKLLMHHARVRGARPAIREKDLGIWQTWTWQHYADEVRALACGLAEQGFRRGQHLALVGDNRPRLYAAICAAQCLGGVPVPLYQDAVATEMAFPIQNAEIAFAFAEDQEQVDKLLEILPHAWIGQNIFSYAQPLVAGYCICCPEAAETVVSDMREVAPTYYFAPPRVFEALLTQVSVRMEDASALKRWLYRSFMAVAKRVGTRILERRPVGPLDRMLYYLGDFLIYGPLRNVLGMSKVRIAYTGGEAIGPDLFSFYRSLGINLKQLYGSTETSVFVCVQPDGQVKSDTVGPAVKGVELKFTPQRELLIRSPGLFKEYYKNPQATREAKDAEGWFHTGDAGYVDQDGHVRIIDRAKDVGKLADGTLFAPKYLENN